MRLAWPPPWHLLASILVPVIALSLVHLPPASWQGPLSLAALILVFFIPGYLVTVWAFPGKSDLTWPRRAGLCLVFSIILAGLFSLLLTATPRELEIASIATVLSLLSIFLAGVAYLRWSDLPRNRRFFIRQRRGLHSGRSIAAMPRLSRPKVMRKHAAMVILILSACFVAALAVAFGPYHALLGDASDEKPFTEMEVTWPEALTSASAPAPGEELMATVRIKNHEKDAMSYTLKLLLGNSTLFSRELMVKSEESWQDQVAFELPEASAIPKHEALYLMLYRNTDMTSPYKQERLLVNLSESEIKTAMAIVTENNSAEALENDSQPIAFSFGGGGGGGGGSSSTASTKKTETEQTTSDSAATENVVEAKNGSAEEVQSSNLSMNDRHIALLSLANQTSEDVHVPASEDAEESKPQATVQDRGKETVENNIIDSNTSLANSPASGRQTSESKADSLTEELRDGDDRAGNAGNQIQIISSAIKKKLAVESKSPISIDQQKNNTTNSEEIEPEETGNHLPKIKSLSSDKSSPQVQGTPIFWTAEATDDERDRIVYKFLLDGQEVKKWSKAGSWSWLTTGLEPGEYLITVLVRDDNHASEDSYDRIRNASFTLIPPNQPPVLKELKSDKTSPIRAGGKITWTAGADDLDGDAVYFKFMKNDEEVTDWQTSDSWIWDTSSETPGDYKITVLSRDGLHASEKSSDGSLESTFVLSEPDFTPRVTDLTSDRNSPQPQGTVITWNAKASDPDDDEISYRFMVDDKPAGDWSLSNSWSWDTSAVMPGDHEIRVLARDGKHAPEDSFDSFKAAAFTITKSNKPPVLRSLVPNATSPQVQGSTVIWKAGAVDPEGDKIFYKFQLNGRDMNRWSESATWKWSSKGQPAGDYRITVLARDGLHASEKSFDSSMDATFSLASEIDLQIAELMKDK